MAEYRTCPYCFEVFDAKNVMFRCKNSSCAKEKDDKLAEFWKDNRKVRATFKGNSKGLFGSLFGSGIPEEGKCPVCEQNSTYMVCPECHNRIPKEMVEEKSYMISIIGARSSGKTNYITVLIDQLNKHLYKLGLSIMPSEAADEPKYRTSIHYKESFYDTLFRNKTCAAQTVIGDEMSRVPLIYRVTSDDKKAPTIYLVFYDTAGENFDTEEGIKDNVKFLNNSDATIFLLDTFQIEYVKDKLGMSDIEGEPYNSIIKNVVNHFTNGTTKKGKKAHFAKPMAVTFSKIDAVVSAADLFGDTAIPNMSLEQPSRYLDGSGFNIEEINSISKSIYDVLPTWGEGGFRKQIKDNYKQYKFFGISALGKKPNEHNEIDKIEPYRVLDPLIWILYELKVPMKLKK